MEPFLVFHLVGGPFPGGHDVDQGTPICGLGQNGSRIAIHCRNEINLGSLFRCRTPTYGGGDLKTMGAPSK